MFVTPRALPVVAWRVYLAAVNAFSETTRQHRRHRCYRSDRPSAV
jgi:hypothetical protein